jgi:hypothetical protein
MGRFVWVGQFKMLKRPNYLTPPLGTIAFPLYE